jgi:transposase-like protein
LDLHQQFCHHPGCPDRGVVGRGNLRSHSRKEGRFRCLTCGKTFALTRGTPHYRRHTPADLVTCVVTLLCHGCPPQAIVAAYGLDERTVAAWRRSAGRHSQRLHETVVQQGRVDARHVQADELWVKMVGRKVWMAMALAVPSRLWLGGVVSPQRDGRLITALVQRIRACVTTLAILVCVDGLASYVTAFRRVFRHKIPRQGSSGRPRLVIAAGLLIGQVVKQYAGRHLVGVARRVVHGSAAAIAAVLAETGTGSGINTAYIERLNATFRSASAPLVRRGRALAHDLEGLQAGMFLVGSAYNFCWAHDSLRVVAPVGDRRKWQGRTPAMAAGLTDHLWTMRELLGQPQRPASWIPPRRRRRRKKRAAHPIQAGVT